MAFEWSYLLLWYWFFLLFFAFLNFSRSNKKELIKFGKACLSTAQDGNYTSDLLALSYALYLMAPSLSSFFNFIRFVHDHPTKPSEASMVPYTPPSSMGQIEHLSRLGFDFDHESTPMSEV